ncbi:MAG: hypothetical protein KGH79_04245 [Patescibacteria group bacterium]|nr:hypothetical protein [Patescibacteria group bacterium]
MIENKNAPARSSARSDDAMAWYKTQRWNKCQRLAAVIYQSALDDEQLNVFIDNVRHTVAEMIPDRTDIS